MIADSYIPGNISVSKMIPLLAPVFLSLAQICSQEKCVGVTVLLGFFQSVVVREDKNKGGAHVD